MAQLSLSSLLWRPTQHYLKGRGRAKRNWGTLSRGFSSGDFGLRSFRRREISAWGVFVGGRFRPEEFLSAGDFDLACEGPLSFIWEGEEGQKNKGTLLFQSTVDIHIQNQTLKSYISKTVRDREKVSMKVRYKSCMGFRMVKIFLTSGDP